MWKSTGWLAKKQQSSLEKNILMKNLLLILSVNLTKVDQDIKLFWKERLKGIRCVLWQSHQIESTIQDSNLSNGLLNYQVGEPNFWKNQIPLNHLIQKILLHLLLALSMPMI